MAIIKQRDKRSGITYVYESVSYWDKEKKQPRSKRTLIGRLDPETGEIVPTDGRGKRRSQMNIDNPAKRGPVPVIKTERLFFGATYLFDQIGIVTGVSADLKTCFPHTYKQILSVAYYLILEDQNPLSVSRNGLHSISILSGRIFLPREAQNFSSPSPKKQRCSSSGFRENGVWRRNTGLMTVHRFPAILRL